MSTLKGTLTDQLGKTETLTLTYDIQYGAAPGMDLLAGTWSATANGLTLRIFINADGSLSGDDSESCTYAGTVFSDDPNVDMFYTTFTRSCSSGSTVFSGLVSYFPPAGSTPVELQFMADDTKGDYLAFLLQPG
jgi:hypothetical protein